MRLKLAISILSLPLLVLGCSRGGGEKPANGAGIAEAQGQLAATEKQAELWKAAARNTVPAGLEKLPIAERPIAPRQRVAVPDRKAERVEPQAAAPSAEAVTGARTLALGPQQILSLYTRAGGDPQDLKSNDKVQIDYRARDDPSDRQKIVALRLKNGDGYVSALESGRAPVEMQIPLFDLAAKQTGQPENGSMPVELRVGKERKVLVQGQIAEFPASRLNVGLISSAARIGAASQETGSNPYAIRIAAWPRR